MDTNKFLEMYNQISYNDSLVKIDLNLLCNIHKYLFKEDRFKGVIFYNKDTEMYAFLENIMNDLDKIDTNISLEDYFELITKSLATIYNYQPFLEGNMRVCIILQKLLLEKFGLKVKKIEDIRELYDNLILKKEDYTSSDIIEHLKKLVLI